MVLDTSTLHLVAALVAALLGSMLLFFGRQQKTPALYWWGFAYLLGAWSVALWTLTAPALGELSLVFNAIGFVACGMVWNAARVFHGREPNGVGLLLGAIVWLAAIAILPLELAAFRLTIGALIIAVYAGLTIRELGLERRKVLQKRWLSALVPVLHGFVLTLPVLLRDFLHATDAGSSSSTWVTFFAVELVLYAVGAVFIIFMLVSERTVSAHHAAARNDPLTGMFNRRGFAEAAAGMIEREARVGRCVSVMMFDIDHFKKVNDRFGHLAGDDILRLFAEVTKNTLRTTDLSGRLGGEEFAAVLPCALDEAVIAAERVREAFATCGIAVDGALLDTTVSIGVAAGAVGMSFDEMLGAADIALYSAKNQGRNRVVAAEQGTVRSTEDLQAVAAPRRAVTVLRKDALGDPA